MSRIQYTEPGAASIAPSDLAQMEKLSIPGFQGLTVPLSRAYALRPMSQTYTGALVRVRRASDNTELDCFSVAQATSFVGSGSGYVSIWYDQSGNNRHIQQTTLAAQPAIVANGVLVTTNGKPAVQFDSTDDFLSGASVGAYAAGGAGQFAVLETVSGTALGRALWHEGILSATTRYALAHIVTGRTLSQFVKNTENATLAAAGSTAEAPALASGQTVGVTVIDDGSTIRKRVNRTLLADVAYTRSGTMNVNTFYVNGQSNGTAVNQAAGMILAELYEIRGTVTTANRDVIESNLRARFPALG
ncbi:hypothetical protein AB0230_07145 [Microbacterium sp. NPDC089190]|uniref:hypothetical protein n=1 Tax=Microbacterium sp. NPDC089190 TaxID=3155063 RepID=UPI0034508762